MEGQKCIERENFFFYSLKHAGVAHALKVFLLNDLKLTKLPNIVTLPQIQMSDTHFSIHMQIFHETEMNFDVLRINFALKGLMIEATFFKNKNNHDFNFLRSSMKLKICFYVTILAALYEKGTQRWLRLA